MFCGVRVGGVIRALGVRLGRHMALQDSSFRDSQIEWRSLIPCGSVIIVRVPPHFAHQPTRTRYTLYMNSLADSPRPTPRDRSDSAFRRLAAGHDVDPQTKIELGWSDHVPDSDDADRVCKLGHRLLYVDVPLRTHKKSRVVEQGGQRGSKYCGQPRIGAVPFAYP